jgi:hypothetical protein
MHPRTQDSAVHRLKSIPTPKSCAATPKHARVLAALLAAVMSASVMAADPAPSAMDACAREADPGKRLACYDRASGRDHRSPPPAAATPPTTTPQTATPPAAAPAPPAALPPAATAPAPPPAPAKAPKHVAARVVSIERNADGFVLHLDNGQVWQHVDSTPTLVDLQAGDQVTLDRSLGSYWLSTRYGPALQVTQKRE